MNKQVTTNSSPSIGRGSFVAATSHQRQSAQQNRSLTQAKVYAMTQGEILASPEVASCMSNIYYFWDVYVLFNLGLWLCSYIIY